MKIQESIKKIREQNHWSQEDMAEKMGMSLNGYGKLERGETRLHLDKLEQIAQIFNIDIVELISSGEKNVCLVIGENNSNYYNANEALASEIEKLKIELSYSKRLLAQKDSEIQVLQKLVAIFESK